MPSEIELNSFHNDWIRLVDKAIFHYEQLSEEERVWFNIQSLIQSVNEGGLDGYYCNFGADHLFDAMAGLKTVGAMEMLDVLYQVNQLFPGGIPPSDIDERNDIMNAWDQEIVSELLDELEEQYYKQEENLEKLLIKHILMNNLNITS